MTLAFYMHRDNKSIIGPIYAVITEETARNLRAEIDRMLPEPELISPRLPIYEEKDETIA